MANTFPPIPPSQRGDRSLVRWWNQVRLLLGDASWVLIEPKTASASATLDFTTGISSAYDRYMFVLTNVRPVTDNVIFQITVSTDGGSTFKTGAMDYEVLRTNQQSDTSGVVAAQNSQGTTEISIAGAIGNGAGEGMSGDVILLSPSATQNTSIYANVVFFNATANAVLVRAETVGSYNAATTVVDGIRFAYSSGNIASGSIALYGLSK